MRELSDMYLRLSLLASIKAAEARPGWRKTLLEEVADELKKAAEEVRGENACGNEPFGPEVA